MRRLLGADSLRSDDAAPTRDGAALQIVLGVVATNHPTELVTFLHVLG